MSDNGYATKIIQARVAMGKKKLLMEKLNCDKKKQIIKIAQCRM